LALERVDKVRAVGTVAAWFAGTFVDIHVAIPTHDSARVNNFGRPEPKHAHATSKASRAMASIHVVPYASVCAGFGALGAIHTRFACTLVDISVAVNAAKARRTRAVVRVNAYLGAHCAAIARL
jgi:hypothetical protein